MLSDVSTVRDALPDERYAARLALGFSGLLAATFGLIVLGALVRAHEAGLACPDWPLCFGEFVPQMNLQVAFEWTHRVIAGGISLVFAGLAALALWRPATRRAAGTLLGVAAALLVVQIILGALTVWELLASWTVTSHLITGNAFALTLLLVACALREAAAPGARRTAAPGVARAALVGVAALLALQMVLGGLVSSRYAGLACPDWPTCAGDLWFPAWSGNVGLHLLHRLNGYALLAGLAASAAVCWRTPALRGVTALALGLGVAQVIAGIANVQLRIPVEVTGLHSALAAALVLATAFALRQAFTGRPAA